ASSLSPRRPAPGRRPASNARPGCSAAFRPSRICAGMRRAARRDSRSNTWTAAPARTPASGATGRRSTPSSSFLATASPPRSRPAPPRVAAELFGRSYAAPIGIAPMGGPSIVWPGADEFLAAAAQAARIPYVLGTVGGTTIEAAAQVAPDVLWFQLYRLARDD